ncbi:MAG: hypothetical protein ACR2F6_02305 [Mycobacteriales bacterium]
MDPVQRLAPYLLEGETLRWTGRPDPRVTLARADTFLLPLGVIWTALIATVVATGPMRPLPLVVGGVFVLAGFYVLAGRFAVKRRRKLRTAYGVTQRRMLVAGPDDSIVAGDLDSEDVTIIRSRDGRHASVIPESSAAAVRGPATYANTGLDLGGHINRADTAFYDVRDPESMLDAVRTAAATKKS